jgi:hypothetical protein
VGCWHLCHLGPGTHVLSRCVCSRAVCWVCGTVSGDSRSFSCLYGMLIAIGLPGSLPGSSQQIGLRVFAVSSDAVLVPATLGPSWWPHAQPSSGGVLGSNPHAHSEVLGVPSVSSHPRTSRSCPVRTHQFPQLQPSQVQCGPVCQGRAHSSWLSACPTAAVLAGLPRRRERRGRKHAFLPPASRARKQGSPWILVVSTFCGLQVA